jgi:hypothetical protein
VPLLAGSLTLIIDGPVDMLRLTSRSKGKQAVAIEDTRLYHLLQMTIEQEPWLEDPEQYEVMIHEYYNP